MVLDRWAEQEQEALLDDDIEMGKQGLTLPSFPAHVNEENLTNICNDS